MPKNATSLVFKDFLWLTPEACLRSSPGTVCLLFHGYPALAATRGRPRLRWQPRSLRRPSADTTLNSGGPAGHERPRSARRRRTGPEIAPGAGGERGSASSTATAGHQLRRRLLTREEASAPPPPSPQRVEGGGRRAVGGGRRAEGGGRWAEDRGRWAVGGRRSSMSRTLPNAPQSSWDTLR